jgi:hypothetical protein
MLTTVGVALATDEPQAVIPQMALPSPPPVLGTDDPWLTRPESGAPVAKITPAEAPGGLTVSAASASDVVRVGQGLSVQLTWRDEDGRLLDLSQEWGDGSYFSAPRAGGCQETSGTSGGSTWFRHSYATPGTYRVRFAVTTVTCDDLTEKRFVSFVVRVVAPAQQPATPDKTKTPAPVPVPSKTPPPPVPSSTPTPTGTPTAPVPPESPPPSPTETPTETPTAPPPITSASVSPTDEPSPGETDESPTASPS